MLQNPNKSIRAAMAAIMDVYKKSVDFTCFVIQRAAHVFNHARRSRETSIQWIETSWENILSNSETELNQRID